MRERVERRLAAILATDVAGYSRLMGADEEGTLERVMASLAIRIGAARNVPSRAMILPSNSTSLRAG
jgi:class 3 adenylate cyclase